MSPLCVHYLIFNSYRCSTGEAWPDIMMSAVSGRACDPRSHAWNYTEYGELYITDPEKRCGSNITYVYFISFIFLCSFIMLNIVVAVITDRYYLSSHVKLATYQKMSNCLYVPVGPLSFFLLSCPTDNPKSLNGFIHNYHHIFLMIPRYARPI